MSINKLKPSDIGKTSIQKKLEKDFKIIFIFLVFIFAIFTLTYRLDKNPPGFFIDEAINGYEAYSIVHNHGFSSSGEFLPRYFRNPDTDLRSHTSFIYFVAVFITLFGINEFSVRLVSVVGSLLIMLLLFYFLRLKASYWAIILGLFCWPVTSWIFLLSRNGIELIFACLIYFGCFLLTYHFFIELGKKNNCSYTKSLILCFLLIALFYIHTAGKLLSLGYFVLIIMVSLLFLFKKPNIKLLVNIFLISTSGLLIILFSASYIVDGSFFYRADDLIKLCPGKELYCFGANILSHFSLKSYFGLNYVPSDFPVYNHSISGTSFLPLFFAPFIIFGALFLIYSSIKTKKWSNWLIFYCLFISTIPASLTIRGFDSWRSYGMIPFLFIFLIFGFDQIINLIKILCNKNYRLINIINTIFFAIIIISATGQLNKLFAYEYNTQAASYSGWQYGYKYIFEYIKSEYNKYDYFIVTQTIGYCPNLYIRFYNPKNIYKKIILSHLVKDEIKPGKKILYAITPGEYNINSFIVKKIIYYPNNKDIAYYLVEKKYAD